MPKPKPWASGRERLPTYPIKCPNCGKWAAKLISQKCVHCGSVKTAVRTTQKLKGHFGQGVPKRWKV